MSPLRSPLYRRLLLWFCAANVATLLVSVFITERLARAAYAQGPDWEELAESANRAWITGGEHELQEWIERRRREGIEATLLENGRNLSGRRTPVMRLATELSASDRIELRPRRDRLMVGQRTIGGDGVPRQFIAERSPRPPAPRMGQLLLVQVGLSLLAIGSVGWWLARSIAQPVAGIGATARRVAGGDLAARVAPRWSRARDEVGELARDFDRMAARIEALVANERSVLQDVSHELRSPLARLHLLLDLARRSPPEEAALHFERAEREIAGLDRLIAEALSLSRLETDLPGSERAAVDLAALARDRAAACALDAESRGIALEVEMGGGAPCVASGSSALLARVIDNLLANAIKFSEAGGRVTLSLAAEADGQLRLSVRDHGPGVPADELGSLFRPFFRGSNAARASGQGLGLGLAIVERIVRAHHGRISARNAADGGLIVSLLLPARSGASAASG